MPYLLLRLMLALALAFGMVGGPAGAAATAAPEALVLGDGNPAWELTGPVSVWLESGTRATIEEVTNTPTAFTSAPALTRHALHTGNTLWMRLRVVRAAGNTAQWTLNVPAPYVDSVTLYQSSDGKQWQAQSAGDTLPQVQWSRRGLYPEFTLDLPSGVPQDVYLQVRNFKHLSLPLRLATTPLREGQRQLESVGLGLVIGTLLTLAALSVIRHYEHKNPFDLKAAWYGLLVAISVAQVNGVLNALLWTTWPTWADYANSILPLVAVGTSLLFVRKLYALSTHFHRYDKTLVLIAWGTLGAVVGYVLLGREMADRIGTAALLAATTAGLLITVMSWRGGSVIGTWLMLAYAPQFMCLMWLVAESFGLVTTHWEMRYLMSFSVALSVPTLIYALSRATHDRKEVAMRADQLPTQDALTGLLTAQAFQIHVEDAYQRAIDTREPVALVLVSVINLERIRATMGDTTAEQCMLRAVIKLHRILRDVDPAARIGTERFAMVLEGVNSRQILTERLVKLVASGLVPLQGLEPEVTLQFQAACVLLHDNPVPPDRVLDDLSAVLAGISPRTRRPIRFLEPVPTQAAPLAPLTEPA
ncbi:7TM-DISM domain-containing protein [Rhodoferax sp.]|uniref:sensor domain-containing diguanylate cyclase n=1 Tax=Rhodoferax sp. TaxID=50421 RepID=UPI002ACDF52C|nr:7TM-DISM domain-containing protein [Rhodoferax sp.]MDZ7918847.1 7TM-DISM domain-containing protein [Rhodoferax sp.]